MVPTHNSELAAAIALYLLYADNEPSAEVYGAAPEETALTVAVTNVMSFFSLLLFVWLLKGAGHMA